MELFDLQNCIKKKEIPHLMIFLGDEYEIMNIYIKNIEKVLGLNVTNLDDASTLVARSRIISIIDPNKLYVCKYDKDFTGNEKVWDNFEKCLKNSYLILIYNELDKRSKFYKRFADKMIVFEKYEPALLKNRLKKLTQLNETNIEKLMEGCEGNYSRCLIEINKLKSYIADTNMEENDAFERLLKNNVFTMTVSNILFDFINKVVERSKMCYTLYDKLKAMGESNVKLISLLYTAFRNQLIVETVNTISAETTGLTPFVIHSAKSRMKKYSIKELERALDILTYTEQGIKNGLIEEPFSVDYILAQVL